MIAGGMPGPHDGSVISTRSERSSLGRWRDFDRSHDIPDRDSSWLSAKAPARDLGLPRVDATTLRGQESSDRPPRSCFWTTTRRGPRRFLTENPQAVWVQTVAGCLEPARRELGRGSSRSRPRGQDVCRHRTRSTAAWRSFAGCARSRATICARPCFFVHTHNSIAGLLMVLADAIERIQSRVPPVRVRPGPVARSANESATANERTRSRATRPATPRRRWTRMAAVAGEKRGSSRRRSPERARVGSH